VIDKLNVRNFNVRDISFRHIHSFWILFNKKLSSVLTINNQSLYQLILQLGKLSLQSMFTLSKHWELWNYYIVICW